MPVTSEPGLKPVANNRFSVSVLICLVLSVCTIKHVQADSLGKINIDITTHLGDVKQFQEGDRIAFLLSLDTDAYLTVLYQNAAGEIIQLLPNRHQLTFFYKAGLFLSLPDPNSSFAFTIQPPFGQETLWVFAADLPLPALPGFYLADGLKKLSVGMSLIRKKLAAHPKSAYGEARLVLSTQARK